MPVAWTRRAVAASKIGGRLDDALLFVPDPMGATGGSLKEAMAHYAHVGVGAPRRVVCVHLIVTPEYVRAVHAADPSIRIHAIRLDRGFSSPEALARLAGHFDVEPNVDDTEWGFDELVARLAGKVGLLCTAGEPVSADKLVLRAPRTDAEVSRASKTGRATSRAWSLSRCRNEASSPPGAAGARPERWLP